MKKCGTVKRELTSIRNFSGYLMEKGVKINSCADVEKDLWKNILLIQKAIDCTYDQYGKTEYIFVDAKAPSRPLQYTTIKHKVLRLIKSEDLRDDDGKLFKFSSHMFRRSYGVKLTEMHLDDWTIAKLLGHKNISAVKHYRKMSNQLLAEETRKAREQQTRILLANLDGWGEEYEQIRQDD